MSSSNNLSINTTVKLSSGYSMPLLGLGVFQNPGASVVPACLAATEAGYRHIDSAQLYANEKEVAEAVQKSGLKREELFVSECCLPFLLPLSPSLLVSESVPDSFLFATSDQDPV
jgi:Aldo/keto reductase family